MNWATCIKYVLIHATNTYVLFHLIYEAKFPLMGNSIRGLAIMILTWPFYLLVFDTRRDGIMFSHQTLHNLAFHPSILIVPKAMSTIDEKSTRTLNACNENFTCKKKRQSKKNKKRNLDVKSRECYRQYVN